MLSDGTTSKMHVDLGSNTATIAIDPQESFFFKRAFLQGHVEFNECIIPPYPLGSVIARIIYGWYFLIKRVTAIDKAKTVQIIGSRPQGSFYALDIPSGERQYVNAHYVVGFSQGLKGIHTHIKVAPLYFCVRKHFFQVFEGPGVVLLYGPSPIQQTDAADLQPGRIIAFDIQRRFTAIPPRSTTIASQAINVLSHEVIWRFIDAGTSVVENRSEQNDSSSGSNPLWGFVKHVLGFFRI